MIKLSKVNKYGEVKTVDTFKPAVEQTNNGTNIVNVHFGTNMDIIILTAKDKQLSKDNLERIRILIDSK